MHVQTTHVYVIQCNRIISPLFSCGLSVNILLSSRGDRHEHISSLIPASLVKAWLQTVRGRTNMMSRTVVGHTRRQLDTSFSFTSRSVSFSTFFSFYSLFLSVISQCSLSFSRSSLSHALSLPSLSLFFSLTKTFCLCLSLSPLVLES